MTFEPTLSFGHNLIPILSYNNNTVILCSDQPAYKYSLRDMGLGLTCFMDSTSTNCL